MLLWMTHVLILFAISAVCLELERLCGVYILPQMSSQKQHSQSELRSTQDSPPVQTRKIRAWKFQLVKRRAQLQN